MEVKEFLLSVPVPERTESYSPVSHGNIINAAYEQLDRHNLVVESEFYNHSRDGRKLIGRMNIIHPDVPHIGMQLVLRNSYDKSMSVAFAGGANVWVCTNGMVRGDIQYMRKHTGEVASELNQKIISTIDRLDEHFQLLIRHSEQLKNIEMTREQYAELVGRLFIIDKVITPTQLNIVSREIDEPTFEDFTDLNAWSLYNHVTYSLKESHPLTYLDQHTEFHHFMEREFQLN